MKVYNFYYLFVLLIIMIACTKNQQEVVPLDGVTVSKPADSNQLSASSICTPPDYGDSILCYQWLGGLDYKIMPINNPGKGRYISTPGGLVIDSVTGEINITKSESGLLFKIGFIPEGSKDTCFTKVITSGINYLDGIKVLSDNDTLLVPIYNGNPAYNPVCGSNGNGHLSGCEYDDDEDDDNGNGLADEPPPGFTLSQKSIVIDKNTGVISLRRSLLSGLFGVLNPANGTTVNATLYYRLSDCSNGALRRIDLKFTYYSKLSDVPKGLINDINDIVGGIVNLLFRSSKDKAANPRPPHIVVVANR